MLEARAKTGWIGVKIIGTNKVTCLSVDGCFGELALLNPN